MENRVSKSETDTESESSTGDDLAEHPIRDEADCLRVLLTIVNKLSTYLEHSEHCESVNDADIDVASQQLLQLAVVLAQRQGIDLPTVYADRLFQIEEANNGLYHTRNNPGVTNPTGAATIAAAESWRELQIGQFLHDQEFHYKILGNPEYHQLRHYTFHIAKLPDYLSRAVAADDPMGFIDSGRLADLVAFGVKLATLRRRQLPELPLPA